MTPGSEIKAVMERLRKLSARFSDDNMGCDAADCWGGATLLAEMLAERKRLAEAEALLGDTHDQPVAATMSPTVDMSWERDTIRRIRAFKEQR